MKKFVFILFSIFVFLSFLNATEFTDTLESKIHTLVNAERVKHGLKPLKKNTQLGSIARGHSLDMAQRDFTAHINPEGLSPTDRAKKAGFKTTIKRGRVTREGVGENIYETQSIMEEDGVKTPYLEKLNTVAKKAITGWMNSPGHRKNILNPDYTMEGTGAAVSKDMKVKVTQMFF
jgi:uncharacterized protein YkwD